VHNIPHDPSIIRDENLSTIEGNWRWLYFQQYVMQDVVIASHARVFIPRYMDWFCCVLHSYIIHMVEDEHPTMIPSNVHVDVGVGVMKMTIIQSITL